MNQQLRQCRQAAWAACINFNRLNLSHNHTEKRQCFEHRRFLLFDTIYFYASDVVDSVSKSGSSATAATDSSESISFTTAISEIP